MLFLEPMHGLMAAGAGVPLLLAIYFLKLRRKPLRVSSTLLWEQAARDLQVNVPLRWLRASWVLLLQLLVVLGLAAALARPAIEWEAGAGGAERVIIVIDHTASMAARRGASAEEGGGDGTAAAATRLEEAKRRAVELVEELRRTTTPSGRRPEAMVVASAAEARIVQPFTGVTSDLVSAIRGVEATDQADPAGVLGSALELIEATIEAGSEDRAGDEVVAFTDAPIDQTRGLPVRVVDVTADEGGPTPVNFGIVAMNVRRDVEAPETIRVFARVTGTGRQSAAVPLRVLFNGAVMGAKSVAVSAAGPNGPGEGTASFEIVQRESGVVLAVIGREDALESDNAAGAVIGPVTSPAVLVVAPTGEDGPARADDSLLGFVESLSPRMLRVVSPEVYEAAVNTARGEGAAGRRAFGEFNLVIFDRVEPASVESVPEQPSISFGAGLPIDGLRLRPAREGGPPRVRFDSWRRADPLMRYVSLEPVVISPAPAVVETDRAGSDAAAMGRPAGGESLAITALASGPDGALIAVGASAAIGPRRVVVSFALARSNWAPDTSFAIFMANVTDALTGRGEAAVGRSFGTAEPVRVRPARGQGVVRAEGPVTVQVEVGAGGADGGEVVSLGVLGRAGVYSISGAVEERVVVNLVDAGESALSRSAGAVVSGGSGEAGAARGPRNRGNQDTGRREIWHWFVLGAMALAAIEWFVFARRIRA